MKILSTNEHEKMTELVHIDNKVKNEERNQRNT